MFHRDLSRRCRLGSHFAVTSVVNMATAAAGVLEVAVEAVTTAEALATAAAAADAPSALDQDAAPGFTSPPLRCEN